MKRILSIYVVIFVVVLILAWCATAHCQTVAPFQGLGNAQFFDNSGVPLTAGVLYSFVAGTSTQQATFTDATGLVQNTNPIAMGTGARANIWLTSGALYKFVLCLQNDGAFCAPSDVLFSVDQVPATSSSSGSGGGGSPFVGTFISGSSTPATSGIIRLSSGDTVCYRNTANSANLCWRKDANDLLSWDGGSLKFPEVGAPPASSGFDVIWADSTAHRWKFTNNGSPAGNIVSSGNDIDTNDSVIRVHFGSTIAPFSGTAPTTNQVLQWNGANIVGYGPIEFTMGGPVVATTNLAALDCTLSPTGGECSYYTFGVSHTLIRLVVSLVTPGVGCGPLATVGVKDLTSATTLLSSSVNTTGITTVTGSVAIPSGDVIGVGLLTAASGCSTFPVFGTINAVYQ